MKYFDSFTGVGGFSLGVPDGWKCVGFAEIDKYASMVLRYNFPDVKNYGDMHEIKWSEVEDFDVLLGGTPCQDLSVAGKRKGLAGERSRLFFEYVRALKEKKPRYFVWENVKGALSSNAGRDFARVLIEFSEAGYSLWWQVLNATWFGVPQHRERIFVAGALGAEPPIKVFFEPEDDKQASLFQGQAANTITARYYRAQATGSYIVENQFSAQKSRLIELTKGNPMAMRVYDTKGIAASLRAGGGGLGGKTGLYAIPVLTPSRETKRQNGRRFKNEGEPMFTLTGQDVHGVLLNSKIRRLTPKECERLMSWPDGWTRWGIDEKGNKVEMRDSQRYKMAGNGVVSKVVKQILEAIE